MKWWVLKNLRIRGDFFFGGEKGGGVGFIGIVDFPSGGDVGGGFEGIAGGLGDSKLELIDLIREVGTGGK